MAKNSALSATSASSREIACKKKTALSAYFALSARNLREKPILTFISMLSLPNFPYIRKNFKYEKNSTWLCNGNGNSRS